MSSIIELLAVPFIGGDADLLQEDQVPQQLAIEFVHELLEVLEGGGLHVVAAEGPPTPPRLGTPALSLPDIINQAIQIEPMRRHQSFVPLELRALKDDLSKGVERRHMYDRQALGVCFVIRGVLILLPNRVPSSVEGLALGLPLGGRLDDGIEFASIDAVLLGTDSIVERVLNLPWICPFNPKSELMINAVRTFKAHTAFESVG